MATDTELFKPSELIINSRGAVYHLNLRPDEIADTVLLVGDPARTDKVARFFDSIELQREHREFRSITGMLKGQRVTVLSTGIGTDNIDIVLNELDALVNIDFETRKEKIEKNPYDLSAWELRVLFRPIFRQVRWWYRLTPWVPTGF